MPGVLRSLPEEARRRWLASLDAETAVELSQSPDFLLRDEQVEPAGGDFDTWLVLTGRGWGKTFAASHLVHRWARDRASIGTGCIVVAGASYGDVRLKCVEAQDGGLLATASRHFMPEWLPGNGRGILRWPNGVVAYCVTGSDPDAFRGLNIARVWADEFCSWHDPEGSWKKGLAPALRRGDRPRAVVTTTPIPLKFLKTMMAWRGTVVTRGSTFDNPVHPQSYLDQMDELYPEGSDLRRQEIDGEIVDDNPRALFRHDTFATHRCAALPETVGVQRKVVGVDPGVSGGDGGDECGIVTCAQGTDGRFYVLSDDSVSGDVNLWPTDVRLAFARYGADLVVAERNQGGAMVETVIRASGSAHVPVKTVWSSHGKLTRAEPVAHLYRRGLVSHVGSFPKLEHQMTSWWPGSKEPSPDRMDALVFALTELAGLGQAAEEEDDNDTLEAYAR